MDRDNQNRRAGPRRVNAAPDVEQLRADLEKYRDLALALGATDAVVIPATDVIVDERVRAKCRIPTCPSYNTNMNCPPYTMTPDEFRTLLSRYTYAVLFKVDITSGKLEDLTRAIRTTTTDIVWRLESEAFYDGHYFAAGFGGTNCKEVLCRNLDCAALAGKGCRHPFKARPGMHGVGIDAFRMAARRGWELYPMGSSCESLPLMSTLGLVLVD